MPDPLPAFLQAVAEQARQFKAQACNPSDLEADWQAYLTRAAQQVPGLTVHPGQVTVCLGELSPGCQMCKDGAWDCLFVTGKCNLSCEFCYNPHNFPEQYAGSALGDTLEEIAANYARAGIRGISFSGGEPFLEKEKLLQWTRYFRQKFPAGYLWIYTNGMLVDEGTLQQLREVGVDEIRFNLAASGYDHPEVLEKLRLAAAYFERLVVEIPAIPAQAEKLKNSLAVWAALGVRHLNLHELMYEPGTSSWEMVGARQEVSLPDGHRTAVHPLSRALILEIFAQVQREGLPLAVNHCSLPNKVHQIRGRRRSLLPLTQAPYEKLVEGEMLESFCLFGGSGDVLRVHPDEYETLRQRYPAYQGARLVRTAPLGVHDPGRWVVFERVV